MECEVSSTQPAAYNGAGSRSSPPSASVVTSSSPVPKTGGGSGKSQLHVDFIEHGEVKEKREKYLTGKVEFLLFSLFLLSIEVIYLF